MVEDLHKRMPPMVLVLVLVLLVRNLGYNMCNCNQAHYTPATIARGVIGLSKVLLGINLAPKEIIDARRNVCRKCSHSTKNNDPKFSKHNGLTSFSKCDLCLCYISAKSQLEAEKCPLDKWPV